MTAAKRDLYIEQGATFQLAFTWNEGTVDEIGPPVDLTGCVARMQIRKAQQQAALLSATSAGIDPAIVLGGATGTIAITLTDDMTDALTLKSALYDLEIEFPDETVYRLLEGGVTVSPNITQESDDPIVGGTGI